MTETTEKYCRNCAHLVGRRDMPEISNGWRCGAEESRSGNNPVTGDPTYKFSCLLARSLPEACGREGKWFEEYIPLLKPSEYKKPPSGRSADDLLGELGGM